LCDNIALINKSKKILDGSVKDIKKQYTTHTYTVDYKTYSSIADNNLFHILDNKQGVDAESQLKIKLNDGVTLNQAISYMLDKLDILQIQEIIPSIHDIFIEKVTTNLSEHE